MNSYNDKIISILRKESESFESIEFTPIVYSDSESKKEETKDEHQETKVTKKIIKKKKYIDSVYDDFLSKKNEILSTENTQESLEIVEPVFSRVNKYKKRCN